jgi:hypothetical protein
MAIVYESMKLKGCQRRQPSHDKISLGLNILLGDVATLVGVAQDQGVNYNVSLKYFGTYAQVSAEPLRWHNKLALMNVDLIHKVDHDNMVWNMLSEREEFQAMYTI